MEFGKKKSRIENLIFGINSIEEALNADKEFEKILVQKGLNKQKFEFILSEARKANIPVSEVPIQKLNQFTRKAHQGIVAFTALISYRSLDSLIDEAFEQGTDPFFILLDNITDVRNFGAIARSSEIFGVNGMIIAAKGGAMINGDAIKTSAGALNHIPVCREFNLEKTVDFLKNRGLRVVSSTEKTEKPIDKVDLKGPLCIVLGAEDIGISDNILRKSDELCRIPQKGKVDSLNVSVAAGISLYEAQRQRS